MAGLTSFSQYRYDSIRLCHTKSDEIRSVELAAYKATFTKGRLDRIISGNGSIQYDAPGKIFKLRDLTEMDSLELQLFWRRAKDHFQRYFDLVEFFESSQYRNID